MPSAMSATKERAVAMEVQEAERIMVAAMWGLQGYPEVRDALRIRTERTHGAAVERFRLALAALPDPPPPEQADAVRTVREQWRVAEEARWRLAFSCRHIAIREGQKHEGPLTADELGQEGTVGLYHAACRYDPARGLRFGTYAKWWVRARITRAIDEQGRQVRLTSTVLERRRNLAKMIRALERSGEAYTTASLAEWLGWTVETVQEAQAAMITAVPLDLPDPDVEDRRHRGEELEAESEDLDERVDEARRSRWLWWAIAQLPPMDRSIVRLINGLDRERRTRTLREVAPRLGISYERVRQRYERALEWMRTLPESVEYPCPPALVGVDAVEAVVLDAIWDRPDRLPALAERTGISEGQVGRAVRAMRARGILGSSAVVDVVGAGCAPPPWPP